MPNGYCAASISKCKLHRQYLCSDCHQVTATGLLKKTPEYLPETQKACTWNGHPKKSIPKHSKRYHGTQSKHAQYWRACIESSQSTIQKQQNSQNSIHLDQKSHSSRDGRVHNDHNHNNSSCATIRNVVSNDVIDISNEQAQDILSYTRKAWNACVKGSILFISALLDNLYGDDGLFGEKYFDNYLPFYMLHIFDIHAWIKLVSQNKSKKLIEYIDDRPK
eukprot:969992_1